MERKNRGFRKIWSISKIRITRTFKKVEDGKEKEIDKTTYEQGNLYVLPNNSLVKNNQAFFYFETDKFDLLESLGVSFNDKRNLSLTDTELADWYEVSVGGLKDLINTNEDEKFLWTKIITPYFESVLKALVVNDISPEKWNIKFTKVTLDFLLKNDLILSPKVTQKYLFFDMCLLRYSYYIIFKWKKVKSKPFG